MTLTVAALVRPRATPDRSAKRSRTRRSCYLRPVMEVVPMTELHDIGTNEHDTSEHDTTEAARSGRYLAAWSATDGERVEPLMIDTGYVEYLEQGWRFDVADGSLQQRISNGPYDSMELFSPMMVYEDRIVVTGSVHAVNVRWLSVIRFTSAGDVKIISESIFI
jgi:hypothetical protein